MSRVFQQWLAGALAEGVERSRALKAGEIKPRKYFPKWKDGAEASSPRWASTAPVIYLDEGKL